MTWAQFEDRLARLVRARNQLDLDHAALLDQLGREGHPQLSPDGDRVHVAGRPDVEIELWDDFVTVKVPGHGKWQDRAATLDRRMAHLILYLHDMGVLT